MILALDISTSCIGYSVFLDSGKLVEASYIKFRDKISKFQKLQDFIDGIKHIDSMPEKIKYIGIEEPLVKFKGKFSNAATIATLNQFNGMVSSWCYLHFKTEPIFFNVNHARKVAFPDMKIDKEEGAKMAVWSMVSKMENLISWKYGKNSQKLLPENFDTSDSYVIGLNVLILLEKQGIFQNTETNEQ